MGHCVEHDPFYHIHQFQIFSEERFREIRGQSFWSVSPELNFTLGSESGHCAHHTLFYPSTNIAGAVFQCGFLVPFVGAICRCHLSVPFLSVRFLSVRFLSVRFVGAVCRCRFVGAICWCHLLVPFLSVPFLGAFFVGAIFR